MSEQEQQNIKDISRINVLKLYKYEIYAVIYTKNIRWKVKLGTGQQNPNQSHTLTVIMKL